MDLNSLILNKVSIKQEEKFVAIIGLNPSKGARSPKLWNRVYRNKNMKIKMYSLDVKLNKFNSLIKVLSDNENFLGGAITNPYKEKIFKLLKSNVDKSSSSIGAINCIYRNNGQLYGTNTDGEGAIFSLKKLGNLYKKKYFIIGTGGTALTLVSFLGKYVKKKIDITVLGRNLSKLKKFKKKFKCNIFHLSQINNLNEKPNFLINCTDLGSITKKNQTPIHSSFFHKLNKSTKVFDVIYNPKQTFFLKLAKKNKLKFTNGLSMNLHQAVSAFVITNKIKKNIYNEIADIMSK